MAYNTRNPLGSIDPRDLYDNAHNLDVLTNDRTVLSNLDRFGVPRKTWWSMEHDFAQSQIDRSAAFEAAQSDRAQRFDVAQEERTQAFEQAQADRADAFNQFLLKSGYEPIGDYDDGPLHIERINQIFSKDGELWRAGPGLVLPYDTLQNWELDQANFVSVGDAALRQQLADTGAPDAGAWLVGWVRSPLDGSIETVHRMLDGLPVNIWEFADHAEQPESGDLEWSSAVAEAIAAGARHLYFPPGRYHLSRVEAVSGMVLFGVPGLSTLVSADPTAIIHGLGISNITIQDLNFEGVDASFAVLIERCSDVTVKDCKAIGCGIFKSNTDLIINRFDGTTDPSATAGYVSENNGCKRLSVFNNDCVGVGAAAQESAILIMFSVNVVCSGNRIENYKNGITYWGGDSNNNRGGIPANPRWVRRLSISGNVVRNMTMGGIWGSMGDVVSITGNTVQDVKDVGIDFEGTFNGVAAGNAVRNASNGCLSTFYFCKNIRFTGNTCAQDGAWPNSKATGPALTMYNHLNGVNNPSPSGAFDVTLDGNSFEYMGGNGVYGLITMTNMQRCQILNNSLRDVIIRTNQQNSGQRVICGNHLVFATRAGAPFSAVEVANTHLGYSIAPGLTLTGNTVQAARDVGAPDGCNGIYVSQGYFGASVHSRISDNEVSGFTYSIVVRDVGTNPGIVHRFDVSDNIVDGQIVNVSEGQPTRGPWRLSNNRNFLLAAVP